MMDSQENALNQGRLEEEQKKAAPASEVQNTTTETAEAKVADAPEAEETAPEAEKAAPKEEEAAPKAGEAAPETAPVEAEAAPEPEPEVPKAEEQPAPEPEAEAPKAQPKAPKAEEQPAPEPEAEAPKAEPEAPKAEPEAPKAGEHPAEAEKAEDAAPEKEDLSKKVYTSKKEIVDRVTEIARNVDNPDKDEVDHLKTCFYKLHIAEREQKQREYLEAGGDPDKYQVLPDEDEETFKAEMTIIKEKRAKAARQQEAEREANLQKRLDIIDKIKGMATSPDAANKSFSEFKQLQQQWKETGPVPPERSGETWRTYQLYVEQFYDLLNLNREAREYDFRKNLEAKTRLCEAAEKLADEPDVISAFHQLQELHQQYRETGPVAKDQREAIWNRFKAASTVINKRHQQHFEQLRAKEEDNLQKKTALCEQVEAIAKEENKGAADWEKHTRQIIDIQKEWKTIGFAPQKMNVKIFERFRAACDDFFGRKALYFKQMKERFADNAAKKRDLVEKAQALADSTDWKSTSDKLIHLQKEWKTIGMVPKKLGDQLWNDFLSACNRFFEARNAALGGQRDEEKANLQKKRDIVAQLKAIAEDAAGDAEERVQELVDEYNAVGHVPFRDKDKVYKEYHDVLDKIYNDLHISVQRRRLDNFRNNLKNVAKRGEDAVDNERSRLMRRYEQLRSEINTFENNLGFLNVSSKKGNSLIDEMNRKVQKLKDDAQLVRDKIKAIDAAGEEGAES